MAASVSYCKNCGAYHAPEDEHLPSGVEGTCFLGTRRGDGYDGPERMVPRDVRTDHEKLCDDEARVPRIDPDANVKNPQHYSQYKIEPITFIEENQIPYSEGNVIKYICRWRQKDGVRDLKKAREYIDLMIRREEGGES